MNLISDDYIQSIVINIANTLKLTEWTYDKRNFEEIAQNYFGILIPTNLSGKNGDNKNITIPLVLKLAPTDERYRVSGAVSIFFAKEIYVYSNILSKYRKLQKKIPLSSKLVMPKCYYVCNDYCKEILAIQNMCDDDYKPYISSMFLDLDHISVALMSLGRLHALSYILRETDENMYNEAKDFCVPLTEKTNKRYMDILIDRLEKALLKFDNTPYVALLETLQHNYVNIIESAANSVQSLCLCHGDMWKENILFKYENNMPTSACIIDYQTTRICSPAFDVLYLIVSSTTSSLRKENFSNLLDIYYQTFDQTLKYAHLNTSEIYSRNMFDSDLKIVGPSCLIVVNTAIWLASGLQEEGHVKSKIILNTHADKLKAVMTYKNTISGILDDLSAYNYLNTVL